MDRMNWITLTVVSLPETIVVVLLGFTLGGIKIPSRKLFLIGLVQAGFSFILRSLPVPFGLHSIVQIIFLIILTQLVVRLPYKSVVSCLLLSIAVYLVLEITSLTFLERVFPISLRESLIDPVKRILFFLPQFSLMVVIITIIKLTGYKLIDLAGSWDKYE